MYDPHSHSDDRHVISVDDHDWVLHTLSPGQQIEEPDFVFVMDSLCDSKLPFFYPRSRRVAVLKESPTHTRSISNETLRSRFDLVLTHRADQIELGPPFQRVDFSANWVDRDIAPSQPMEKNKLVSFVGSIEHRRTLREYDFRRNIAGQLRGRNDIDLFGRGIHHIEHKAEGLMPYCFSVAMENCREDFYYSEKLIDCFFCETVPVYWGCPSIGDLFDLRGMIVFSDSTELMNCLNDLSFEKYQAMLPYVRENRQRCIDLKLDSYDNYLARCIQMVKIHLGESLDPLQSWKYSKPMAGLRWLVER